MSSTGTDIFIPRGYASRTFCTWRGELEEAERGSNSQQTIEIQPFSVYQQDHPHPMKKHGNHLGAMPRCRKDLNESLDLVRKVLQPAINQDIVEVFKKYLSVFRDAADNINVNMRAEPFHNYVSEIDDLNTSNMVYKLCSDALDHCKTLFDRSKPSNGPQKSSVLLKVPVGSPASKPTPVVVSSLPNRLSLKRVPSPDFPWTKRLAKSSPRRSLSPTPRPTKRSRPNPSRRYGSPLQGRVPSSRENWDPDRLTTDTKFIMGTKANKALGLGATRGRIYMKHPELFKYSSDPEDKKWMVKNNCMMATGGKNTFILIADDIYDLLDNEYKDSPHVMRDEMQVFKLPEFILQKMRNLMGKDDKFTVKVLSKPVATPPSRSEIQARSAESSPSTDAKSAYQAPSPMQHSKRSAAEKATAVIIATAHELSNAARSAYVENSDPDSSSLDDGSGSDYERDDRGHGKE